METKNRRLMLISNSFCFGQGYLDHCAEAIKLFLGPITTLLFIPYALKDWDKYTQIARERFAKMGITVIGIHENADVTHFKALQRAEAVFIGGGNTFRLLAQMYRHELLDLIRDRVDAGMPFLGASAGSNVACPTIMTTNDMPIVQPPGFRALDLVPFQINPHYLDPDPASKHMGESREKRIAQFYEENDAMVIGLREGSWITVENGSATLCGVTGAKIFVPAFSAREWTAAEPLRLWEPTA